jgi:hypothetical protein
LATLSVPITPPAPGRFSTTTGCPSFTASASAITRAVKSLPAPAVNGTMSLTGLLG